MLRRLVVWWLLFIPVAGFAASGDEFYQRLYQRGLAHFAAGEFASAFTELRQAAFGFVEQVDTFEAAQAYACIAAHRLGHDNDARDSLMRIVAAEKVQPHFRSVKLPDALRAEIHTLAAALLTSQEAAVFGVAEQVQDAVATKPAVIAPAQPLTPTAQPVTPTSQPVAPAPKSVTPAPKPVIKTASPPPQPVAPPVSKSKVTPAQPAQGADSRFVDAQLAIDNGDIGHARSIYAALLSGPPLTHEQAVRLAEGLFVARDFASATQAFQRVGSFSQGEEPYRYDYAVALYETGHYKDAKRELAAALPFIAMTSDVTRNRAKIEGAIE